MECPAELAQLIECFIAGLEIGCAQLRRESQRTA